jgi:hypothetical protein
LIRAGIGAIVRVTVGVVAGVAGFRPNVRLERPAPC